jgi:hypothetical protein
MVTLSTRSLARFIAREAEASRAGVTYLRWLFSLSPWFHDFFTEN